MNWADWAIIAVLGASVLISVIRGFVREAMSLVVWAAALAVAMFFYQHLALWLVDVIDTPSLRFVVAWLVLFIAVLIVGGMVNYLLGQMIRATGLSGTDRLLGVIFGGARGAIVVLVVLIVLPGILPVDEDPWWRESLLVPEFLRFEGWARDTAMTVTQFFRELF